jgi:hypothetical protein
MCTREVPDDPCSAPGCVDAKNKLNDARSRFNSICSNLRMLNSLATLLKQVLSTPLWVIIVAVIMSIFAVLIGGVLGGLIAVGIWVLIAIYGISWFLVGVIGKVAQSLAASLAQAQRDFADALKTFSPSARNNVEGTFLPSSATSDSITKHRAAVSSVPLSDAGTATGACVVLTGGKL